MPSQQKKQWAQLRVGVLAIAALILLAFLIFLMTGSKGLFTGRSDIYTYLDDSAALAQGSPVRLNGIAVGEVSKVELSGLNEKNRIIRITLEIDNKTLPSIPDDSQAGISAENLLGTKYINIAKGKSTTPVKAGGEIKSVDTTEFQDVVQQGYSTLAALNGIFGKLDGIITSIQVGQGTIGKLLSDDQLYKQLLDITKDTHQVIETLNSDQGTLGKLMHDSELYDNLKTTTVKVNTLMEGLEKGEGTAGKLLKDPALYNDLRSTIADARTSIGTVNKILADVESGKGTAGKLLKSDELHDQLRSSMGKLDSIMDKLNNGQGTLGQLLVNPSMYESLDGTTRELNGLVKDFRANPKKFLRIKLAIF
jgi:phospholipid/cholesterol/gamma-HCH transport system substrate-binding protein